MLTHGGIVMAADRQISQFPKQEKIASCLPLPPNINHINNFLIDNVQQICDSVYEKNKDFYKVATKSTKKLFAVSNNIAFSTGQTLHTKEFYPVELLADQFCRKNTFDKPKDAAQSLFEFMSSKDDVMDLHIHLAGYDKEKDYFIPEFYEIKTAEGKCEYKGNTGFLYAGANDYFTPFTRKIGSQVMIYSIQDAVDICCLAIEMNRKLGLYMDFQEIISEDYEIIVITLDGLQWVKKAKLEVKQW
jgi:hypothetical protein